MKRNTIRNLVVSILLLSITVLMLSSCRRNLPATSEDKGTADKVPVEDMVKDPLGISVGEKYTVKGRSDIYAHAFASYGTMGPVAIAFHSEEYTVKEISDGFARVESDKKSGWIPLWYLTKGGEEINDIKRKEMIVKAPCRFSLTPEGGVVSDFELKEGQIAHVMQEYKDSYSIEITTYDSPYSGKKWVKKDALAEYDPKLAMEGYIKKGAKMYNDKGEVTGSVSEDIGPVRIEFEFRGTYYVMAAGGWTSYIDKKDFVPNQFEYVRGLAFKDIVNKLATASKIELTDEGAQSKGVIEGNTIKAFIDIIRESKLGTYPENLTGGEGIGELHIHFPDGKVGVRLTSHYINPSGIIDEWYYGYMIVFKNKEVSEKIQKLFEKGKASAGGSEFADSGQLKSEKGDFESIDSLLKKTKNIFDIRWSMDKTKAAFAYYKDEMDDDAQMYIWKTGESQPKAVDIRKDRFCEFFWSPDGEYVIADSGTSVVRSGYIVSAGEYRLVDKFTYVFGAVWSPDSSQIAFGKVEQMETIEATELEGTVDVVVYNFKTREQKIIARGSAEYYFSPLSWHNDGTLTYRKGYFDTSKKEEVLTQKM